MRKVQNVAKSVRGREGWVDMACHRKENECLKGNREGAEGREGWHLKQRKGLEKR